MEASWAVLGDPKRLWRHLGLSWKRLGVSWMRLGVILGRVGLVFVASWWCLGVHGNAKERLTMFACV